MLTDWDKMSNLYKRTFHRCFLPSFGSFGHAVSEEKIFRNKPIRIKNRLWWPCFLMDWDRMSNLYRGPSIDASYQVSDHLAMWFQRRFLEIDQSETRIVDASYQVSDHLAKRFQRRRILKISQSETRIACGGHVG